MLSAPALSAPLLAALLGLLAPTSPPTPSTAAILAVGRAPTVDAAAAARLAGQRTPGGSAGSSSPAGLAAEAAAPRGAWRWPLSPQPQVRRRFDPPAKKWLPGHRGVDLQAGRGDAVLAPADGTVAFSGVIAGTGVVALQHADGVRTTYQPVDHRPHRGARVRVGQRLGTLAGPSHCAPAMCLHWGALVGPDSYIDPLSLLGLPPVLLPLRR